MLSDNKKEQDVLLLFFAFIVIQEVIHRTNAVYDIAEAVIMLKMLDEYCGNFREALTLYK